MKKYDKSPYVQGYADGFIDGIEFYRNARKKYEFDAEDTKAKDVSSVKVTCISEDELQPCPCCGQKTARFVIDRLKRNENNELSIYTRIYCPHCEITTPVTSQQEANEDKPAKTNNITKLVRNIRNAQKQHLKKQNKKVIRKKAKHNE